MLEVLRKLAPWSAFLLSFLNAILFDDVSDSRNYKLEFSRVCLLYSSVHKVTLIYSDFLLIYYIFFSEFFFYIWFISSFLMLLYNSSMFHIVSLFHKAFIQYFNVSHSFSVSHEYVSWEETHMLSFSPCSASPHPSPLTPHIWQSGKHSRFHMATGKHCPGCEGLWPLQLHFVPCYLSHWGVIKSVCQHKDMGLLFTSS